MKLSSVIDSRNEDETVTDVAVTRKSSGWLHCRWAVYADAYEWVSSADLEDADVTDKTNGGPFLSIPRVAAKRLDTTAVWRHEPRPLPFRVQDHEQSVRVYSIERQSGLFMTFAKMEPTTAGVLRFARHYGHLGLKAPYLGSTTTGRDVYGEPFRGWEFEIGWMRVAVEAWELLRAQNEKELAKRVTSSKGSVRYNPLPDRSPRDRAVWEAPTEFRLEESRMNTTPQDLVSIMDQPTPQRVTRAFIQNLIRTRLRDCPLDVLGDEGYNALSVQIVPRTLLAAMWAQFAIAVAGNPEFKQCSMCTNWFQVARGARRQQSVYCSDACKTRATRERRKRAIELARRGMNHRSIAKAVGSRVETVKGWVAGQ
jgi:hypothetical protein